MENIRIEEKIIFLLEKICQAYKNNLWQIAYREGLTPTQMEILQIVLSYPKANISHIAKELGISKPTVSQAVNTLIKKGMLIHNFDPLDKRKKILNLTSKARKFLKRIRKLNDCLLNCINQIDPDQQNYLYKILLIIIKEMHEKGIFKLIRFCPFCANRISDSQSICIITNRPVSPENFRPNCPHFKEIN